MIPTLSVVLPTKNSIETLPRWLSPFWSLEQSFLDRHIEIIQIDGFSSDGSDNFFWHLPNIKSIAHTCVSQKPNGIYEAINTGYKLARGKWIVVANSDDYFISENLCNFIQMYLQDRSEPVYDAIFAPVFVEGYGVKCASLPSTLDKPIDIDAVVSSHSIGFFIRRDFVVSHKLSYSLSFSICSDYDFFIRLIAEYKAKLLCIQGSLPVGCFSYGGISSLKASREIIKKEKWLISRTYFGLIFRPYRFLMKTRRLLCRICASYDVALIGGTFNSFDGGQASSIPELYRLFMACNISVIRVSSRPSPKPTHFIKSLLALLRSKAVIFNSDFYPVYPLYLLLSLLIGSKVIFIPRGAYNNTRLCKNPFKFAYIYLLHSLSSPFYVFLSKTELSEVSYSVLTRKTSRTIVINPTFSYLRDLELRFTGNHFCMPRANNILFAGRGPTVYKGLIRDPKGFTYICRFSTLFNQRKISISAATNLSAIDARLIRFNSFDHTETMPQDLFFGYLMSHRYLFQFSSEGEGFSQLIAQALFFGLRIICDSRSIPCEIVERVVAERGQLPDDYWLSGDYKHDYLVIARHIDGFYDDIHILFYNAFRSYLDEMQTSVMLDWIHLLKSTKMRRARI